MHANRLEASDVLDLFTFHRRPRRVGRRRRRVDPLEGGPVAVGLTAATYELSRSVTGVPVPALLE